MQATNLKIVNGLISFETAEDTYTMTLAKFYKALYTGVFTQQLVNIEFLDCDQFIEEITKALSVKVILVKCSSSLTANTMMAIGAATGVAVEFTREFSKKRKFSKTYFYSIGEVTFKSAQDCLNHIKNLGFKIYATDNGCWKKEL